MKNLQNPGRFQALGQFGVQAAGKLVLFGVVVILVSAWALTELVYELGKWIVRSGNLMVKTKN